MSTQIIPIEPDTLATPSTWKRSAAHQLRQVLKYLGVLIYHLGLARFVIQLSPERIRTLLYHAVENQPDSYTAGLGMSISPAVFRIHLDYYQKYYNVVPMRTVIYDHAPACSALITFDDGYASVGQNAVPALEERAMPATVFLIGKALRGGIVWVNQLNYALNRYPKLTMAIVKNFQGLSHVEPHDLILFVQTHFTPHAIEQLIARLEKELPLPTSAHSLFLTIEDVQALKARNIAFGFHTNDHYNLRLCNEHSLHQQLDSSEFDGILDSKTFAYPFGYCGDREADRLEERGFQKVMLVSENTPHPRTQNLTRSEPSADNPAEVFAQLEIVEPLMNWLRGTLRPG